MKITDPPAGGSKYSSAMTPIGSIHDIANIFSRYNTAPDGSGPSGFGEALGVGILYGPGFIVEVPSGQDEIAQIMATITDEDFAWAVLMRLCRTERWKMLDPESGRTFG